jgi:hypothetical protein
MIMRIAAAGLTCGAYPSHGRLPAVHRWQDGLASSHLIRRRRQVMQPVLTRDE